MLTHESTASFLIGLVSDTVALLLRIPLAHPWLYRFTGLRFSAERLLPRSPQSASLWAALPLAYVCVLGNMLLAYSHQVGFTEPLEGLIHRRGYGGVEAHADGTHRGNSGLAHPLILQNLILALAEKPDAHLLIIPIQAIIATGIITTGASLLQGSL